MSLEQTAKQMRKQYMTVSDKYCDKHQGNMSRFSFQIANHTQCVSFAIGKSKSD